MPNAVELQIVPFFWVEHTYFQSQAASALLSRALCTMNWAPWLCLSCLHCSAAGQAFEEQDCAQLIPKEHCQCTVHCQAWLWPSPSCRHVLALFKVPSFRALNVFYKFILKFIFIFILFSSFLPGWKADIVSSFFYISPFIFFSFYNQNILTMDSTLRTPGR